MMHRSMLPCFSSSKNWFPPIVCSHYATMYACLFAQIAPCVYVHRETVTLIWGYGDTFSGSATGNQFVPLVLSDLFCYFGGKVFYTGLTGL